MKPRLRHALTVAAVGVALLAAAAGGLIYRLKQGPLDLPQALAAAAADRLGDPARGLTVRIDRLALALADDPMDGHGRLEAHAYGVAVAGPDGKVLATVPEAGLGVSAAALLRGVLRPTRIELIRPRVTVARQADGGFGFDIAASPEAEADGAATPVATDLLAALVRPPDATALLGLLHTVTVRDGDVTLIDDGRALRARANPATFVLQRGAGGVDGRMRLMLETGPAGPSPSPSPPSPALLPLEATVAYDAAGGIGRVTAIFSGLRPAAVAHTAAELAPLAGIDAPLDGRIEARLGPDFRLDDAVFSLRGGAGRAGPAGGRIAPADILGLTAAGRYDADARRVTLEQATLRLDGLTAEATGTVDLTADGGVLPQGRATLRPDGFNPARLAALSPDFAPAAGLDFAVTGAATAELRDGRLSGSLDLTLGAGTLQLNDLFAEPLPVRDGRIRASGDADAGTYRLEALELNLDGPQLTTSVDARIENGRVTTAVEAALTAVPVPRLGQLWPPAAAPKPRIWVLENLTGGVASHITASAVLSAPLADLTDVTPEKATARIEVENGELHYFRPLPPAVKIERMVADFDGKDFLIRTKGGEVSAPGAAGPVRAGDGVVRIINVGTPREDLMLDIGLTGPLRTVLTVVDMPPLGYPSKLDIKPDKTSGHVDGRLKLAFPLFDSVKLDDLEINVAARATGAAIEKVVAGRDAAEGDLAVELDTRAMTVSGKARFDGAPITVTWREVFDAEAKGPGTVLEAEGRSDVRHLATFGPDLLTEYARGPVGVKARYASGENRRATLNVELDLTPTDIRLGPLDWRKGPGAAAQSRFVMHFKDGKPTRIADLRLDGPGLQATAAVQLAAGGDEVARIDAPRVRAGATDMAVTAVRERDGGYLVRLSGAAYDLRGVLGPDDGFAPPAGAEKTPSPPMTVEMTLDRLLFGDDRGLSGAEGRLRREKGDWSTIGIRGRTPPRGELAMRLERTRDGGGRLTIDGDDAGASLRALDITDRVRGGMLKVRGRSATAGMQAPLDGVVTMTDYTLVDAPALARILNAMSVTGLAELLSGQGISFGSLTGSFRKEGDLLRLRDMRTSGGALGLTVEGEIDLARDTARLNGTVVPIYGLNRIIGQIPLLGDLLSGGPGQGIFAATWTIDGPLADPQVSVNPLALLTPGFLRNLFFGGPASGSGDDPPAEPESRR